MRRPPLLASKVKARGIVEKNNAGFNAGHLHAVLQVWSTQWQGFGHGSDGSSGVVQAFRAGKSDKATGIEDKM